MGSNIFNCLLGLGAAGVTRPLHIEARLIGVDVWIMIVVSAAFIPMAALGKRIGRTDGVILLTGYVAYMFYVLTCP